MTEDTLRQKAEASFYKNMVEVVSKRPNVVSIATFDEFKNSEQWKSDSEFIIPAMLYFHKEASTSENNNEPGVNSRDLAPVASHSSTPSNPDEAFGMVRLYLLNQLIDLRPRERELREKVNSAKNDKQKAFFLKALTNTQNWIKEFAEAYELLGATNMPNSTPDAPVSDTTSADSSNGDDNQKN